MLLNTFDIDVLQKVLHFMIRPAQRINNPKAIRSSFTVPQDKIIELIKGWNQIPIQPHLDVSPKMLTLNLQFYRTSDNNNTEEGLETINYVFTDQDFEKDDIDLFIQFVNEYNIPKENHFDLANRIRIIKHVKNFEERQTLLAIRILSIAIMGKIHYLSSSKRH